MKALLTIAMVSVLLINGCGLGKFNTNGNNTNNDDNLVKCGQTRIDIVVTRLNWEAIDITCVEKGKTLQVTFRGKVYGYQTGAMALKLARKDEAFSDVAKRFLLSQDSHVTAKNPEDAKEHRWYFSSSEIQNGNQSPTLVIFNPQPEKSDTNIDGRLTFDWIGIGN